jgi:hypothetical protein
MLLKRKAREQALITEFTKKMQKAEANLNAIIGKRAQLEDIIADGTKRQIQVLNGIDMVNFFNAATGKTLDSIVERAYKNEMGYVGYHGPPLNDERRAELKRTAEQVTAAFNSFASVMRQSIADMKTNVEAVARDLDLQLDDFLT